MALETSGFQLSQFERAPQIPGNIGVVDTKSIYGSVVDALKANEALRTAQAVQATTDAELALAQQRAQTEAGLLAPEAEARRAKAQLFTAGVPFEMELLAPRAGAERAKNVLAAATDTAALPLVPERVATERAKLGAERTLGEVMSNKELVQRIQENRFLSSAQKLQRDSLAILADPNATDFARRAAAISLGFEPKAVAPGIGYQVLTDANGVSRLVAVNKAAVGAQDIATGQVIGVAPGTRPSMAPAPGLLPGRAASTVLAAPVEPAAPGVLAAPAPGAPAAPGVLAAPAAPAVAAPAPAAPAAPAEVAAPLVPTAPAPTRVMTAEDWLVGPSAEKKLNEKEIAEAKGKALQKLPSLQANLSTLRRDVLSGEQALDKAQAIIETWSPSVMASLWRDLEGKISGTEVTNVRNLLNEVKAKIFTNTLAEMRANSPTGAAVGNVSDVEGARLMASLGSLELEQSPEQLLENIKRVKEQRRASVNAIADTIGAYETFLRSGSSGVAGPSPSVEQLLQKYRTR